MNGWVRFAGILLATLLLTGCAKWHEMFDKDDASTVQTDTPSPGAFVEVQTKEPIGLKKIWDVSLASAADEHMQHPRQVVVSGSDVFLGTFQGDILRLDRENGRVLWKKNGGDSVVGGVAVGASRVFAGTRSGEMLALSREDGSELWRASVSTSVASAPVVAGDTVIFLTLDNRTYALNSVDGTRLWVHSTTPEALVVMGAATPTVAGDNVYVGYATGEVFALSLKEGTPVWMENLSVLGGRSELDLLQDVDAGIVVPESSGLTLSRLPLAFSVNHRGRAVAMHLRTGAKIWEQSISAIRRPLLVYGRLLLSDMEGNVVALSSEDGLGLWRTRLTEGLLTAPVAMGEKILVADDRGNLFSLDAASGRVLGMDPLGDAILADPVVADNSLFLWTNEGDFLRYDF